MLQRIILRGRLATATVPTNVLNLPLGPYSTALRSLDEKHVCVQIRFWTYPLLLLTKLPCLHPCTAGKTPDHSPSAPQLENSIIRFSIAIIIRGSET